MLRYNGVHRCAERTSPPFVPNTATARRSAPAPPPAGAIQRGPGVAAFASVTPRHYEWSARCPPCRKAVTFATLRRWAKRVHLGGARTNLGTVRVRTTWGMRAALGDDRWWQRVAGEWHQHVDGLWRKKDAQAQATEKRKTHRPLVVRWPESRWNLDQFLAHRRRAGRDDIEVVVADQEEHDEAAEVVIVRCDVSDEDAMRRRSLYRARQRATHAVVAVVDDHGVGRRTEEYLGLCAGADRRRPLTSGSEDRLAQALKTQGIDALRQVPVGRYQLDFLIRGTEGDTDVEVDGRYWHTDENGDRLPGDRWRDEVLAAVGLRTVRVWAEDVDKDPDHAAAHVLQQHRQL